MQSSQTQGDDFVASFSFQRQRLVYHANTLLHTGDGVARPEKGAELAQALVASLEVLKVAEEELRDERRRTASLVEAQERRLAHAEALFEQAPTALLLTTADTSIRQINAAASRLVASDQHRMAGKQLLSLIPRDSQNAFREQLAHVIAMQNVAAWSFTIQPQRQASIVVSASVDVIDDPAVGARALYWNLRPLQP
jgi:PAS domain S-box-containing protein